MRRAGFVAAVVALSAGCASEARLAFDGDDTAGTARETLRRFGVAAEVGRRGTAELLIARADRGRAEALLHATGFDAPADAAVSPLVAGPAEVAARERRETARALEAALRAQPDVLNARVVPGDAGAAVFLWRPAGARPPEAAILAARAVYGAAVQVVDTPVEPGTTPAGPGKRATFELPLAALALVLAATLFIVSRRRRAEVRG